MDLRQVSWMLRSWNVSLTKPSLFLFFMLTEINISLEHQFSKSSLEKTNLWLRSMIISNLLINAQSTIMKEWKKFSSNTCLNPEEVLKRFANILSTEEKLEQKQFKKKIQTNSEIQTGSPLRLSSRKVTNTLRLVVNLSNKLLKSLRKRQTLA